MPAEITFYPLGNADTALIRLADEKLVLVDFANMRNGDDTSDKRCNLSVELRKELENIGQEDFDVVCFTHLDEDHIKGMEDFFELRSKKETQNDNRPKIKELWVPAAAITEIGSQVKKDAWAIRQEARRRLIDGTGIKVFSRPDDLKSFLEEKGLTVEARSSCIIDAGRLIPGFTLDGPSNAEFFLHCPFAWATDDRGGVNRNQDSVVFQVTFNEGGQHTRAIFGSDVDSDTLSQIVKSTKKHKNEDRLAWDILKLYHHCSSNSLDKSDQREGDETVPVPEVKWLIEEQGASKCRIVSPSKPIPTKGSEEDKDNQPPHRQAASYYKRILGAKSGKFMVTMEHPSESTPKPIKIMITRFGQQVATIVTTGAGLATERTTRQG